MQKYFYPLSTKDYMFENIFSTESISPASFYKKRGFGISYSNILNQFHSQDAIILYTTPPMFQINFGIRFILEIYENALAVPEIVKITDNVYAYTDTIYLKKNNFRILFFSEKDLKIAILQSEVSLPTKSVKKYKENFAIVGNEQSVEFLDITTTKFENPNIENKIATDRKFNFFKGFVYGIVTGIICHGTGEISEIKKALQEITNSYAEFKNRLYDELRANNNRAFSILMKYHRTLSNAITDCENRFLTIFPEEKLSEDRIVSLLQNQFASRLSTEDAAIIYLNSMLIDDQIFGTDKFVKVSEYLLQQTDNIPSEVYFSRIKRVIESYAFGNNTLEKLKNMLETSQDDLKESLFRLSENLNRKQHQKKDDSYLHMEKIAFEPASNKVKIAKEFYFLDVNLLEEVCFISTEILKNTEFNNGIQHDIRLLALVESVEKNYIQSGRKSNLIQYLNNDINEYVFENVSNVVKQNFVAFTFNSESLEALEGFLDNKKIQHKWIAYSFWCAFNGFAKISKNFALPLFETADPKFLASLEEYLESNLNKIRKLNNLGIINTKITENKEYENLSVSGQNLINTSKLFYDQNIKGKFKISQAQFEYVWTCKEKNTFIEFLQKFAKISKSSALKVYRIVNAFNNSPLFKTITD